MKLIDACVSCAYVGAAWTYLVIVFASFTHYTGPMPPVSSLSFPSVIPFHFLVPTVPFNLSFIHFHFAPTPVNLPPMHQRTRLAMPTQLKNELVCESIFKLSAVVTASAKLCSRHSHEQMVENGAPVLGSFEEVVDGDLESSVASVTPATGPGADRTSK